MLMFLYYSCEAYNRNEANTHTKKLLKIHANPTIKIAKCDKKRNTQHACDHNKSIDKRSTVSKWIAHEMPFSWQSVWNILQLKSNIVYEMKQCTMTIHDWLFRWNAFSVEMRNFRFHVHRCNDVNSLFKF